MITHSTTKEGLSLPNFDELVDRMFTNDSGDQGSIQGRVIPKAQKIVLDATLLSTQHYKVQIKGKLEQSRVRSSAFFYTSV